MNGQSSVLHKKPKSRNNPTKEWINKVVHQCNRILFGQEKEQGTDTCNKTEES